MRTLAEKEGVEKSTGHTDSFGRDLGLDPCKVLPMQRDGTGLELRFSTPASI